MGERVSNAELQKLIERVEKKFDEDNCEIKQLCNLQSVQTEQIKNLSELTKKMHETLYGNGKIGLTTKVDNLEREISKQQFIKNTVVTAVISIVVSGLFSLLVLQGSNLVK
jgi:hypothetical protein